MKRTGVALLDQGAGRDILKRRCREAGIPVAVIDDLVGLEFEHLGRGRRRGLPEQIGEILAETLAGMDEAEPGTAPDGGGGAMGSPGSVRRGVQGVLYVHPNHPAS